GLYGTRVIFVADFCVLWFVFGDEFAVRNQRFMWFIGFFGKFTDYFHATICPGFESAGSRNVWGNGHLNFFSCSIFTVQFLAALRIALQARHTLSPPNILRHPFPETGIW